MTNIRRVVSNIRSDVPFLLLLLFVPAWLAAVALTLWNLWLGQWLTACGHLALSVLMPWMLVAAHRGSTISTLEKVGLSVLVITYFLLAVAQLVVTLGL